MLGWVLLFVLVPSRHFLYNHDAPALLLTTLVLAAVVLFIGYNYKGLSGWCTGVCPIRPVEMMYGQFTPERCRPEVCMTCEQCNVNCSRNNVHNREVLERNNTGFKYFIFSFPGFVLGYYLTGPGMSIPSMYGVIYGLSLVSLIIACIIDRRWPAVKTMNHSIILALVIYYAFAIPGLVEVWGLSTVTTSTMFAVTYGIIALNVIRSTTNPTPDADRLTPQS